MLCTKKLCLPLDKTSLENLNCGDIVLLNGKMLSFRDAGHKKLFEDIEHNCQPFEYAGEAIYFMGPCPAQKGKVIGSAGPTTSCRMDKYTPYMLDNGLACQIGKGHRDKASIDAFVRNKAVYFAAIGGAGAIYSDCIKDVKLICYDELATEAVRMLEVSNFPVVVAIDTKGNSIYK